MKKSVYIVSATLLCISVCLWSCIGWASDDEVSPLSERQNSDSAIIAVDTTFYAPQGYFVGEWIGDYVGFDVMQDTVSSIRRRLIFSGDGIYDNYVQGIMGTTDDPAAMFLDFEHEHGRYAYDSTTRTTTYYVEYDSLVNYFTQRLEYNPGKLLQGVGILPEYTEVMRFSPERNGVRLWLRTDENLKMLADHSVPYVYVMNRLKQETP